MVEAIAHLPSWASPPRLVAIPLSGATADVCDRLAVAAQLPLGRLTGRLDNLGRVAIHRADGVRPFSTFMPSAATWPWKSTTRCARGESFADATNACVGLTGMWTSTPSVAKPIPM